MKSIKKIFWMVGLILSLGSTASAESPTMLKEPTVSYSADSIEEKTTITSYNPLTKPRSYSEDNPAEYKAPTSFTYPMERLMVKVYRAPGKERREVEKNGEMTKANGEFIFFDGFIWTTPEGITIKTEGVSVHGDRKTQIKYELKNLKIGEQEPSLFEIPEGYTDIGELINKALTR